MGFEIFMLIVSLALILLASIIFTNGIEQLGAHFNLHQGAVGSILAAVGTALPETIVPIIAILVYHNPQSYQVGIGAIAGAPFMLATLAFFATGAAVLVYAAMGKRSRAMHIDPAIIIRDLSFFVCLYGAAILATFAHSWPFVKGGIAFLMLLSYGIYVKRTLASDCKETDNLEPLFACRFLKLPLNVPAIAMQVAVALVLMIWSAHMFIGYVSAVSVAAGVSAMILSIIITPIATELPEKCNSVLWIGKRKDILAVGNVTGAMVFQSSFPVVFGILFTEWDLRGIPMVSALIALASSLFVLAWVKTKKSLNPYILMTAGILYVAFLLYLFLRSPNH